MLGRDRDREYGDGEVCIRVLREKVQVIVRPFEIEAKDAGRVALSLLGESAGNDMSDGEWEDDD